MVYKPSRRPSTTSRSTTPPDRQAERADSDSQGWLDPVQCEAIPSAVVSDVSGVLSVGSTKLPH
ncbi:hypothetical protein ANCDUO_04904 [Ancylostoma duodenale]|uniref:Uncharacterized protein n=1 Tax=Ancylostoma duodenale TaxID=51022 RepID=A0A0C2GTY4_9BILA|nr:hypothetical protein ANCDUO_04904 [Ancylostoma duodenale]